MACWLAASRPFFKNVVFSKTKNIGQRDKKTPKPDKEGKRIDYCVAIFSVEARGALKNDLPFFLTPSIINSVGLLNSRAAIPYLYLHFSSILYSELFIVWQLCSRCSDEYLIFLFGKYIIHMCYGHNCEAPIHHKRCPKPFHSASRGPPLPLWWLGVLECLLLSLKDKWALLTLPFRGN